MSFTADEGSAMKKIQRCALLAAGMLCLTACSGESSIAESSTSAAETQDGITLHTAEDVDTRYAETLKRYFDAINAKDYDAYLSTVYPPYSEAYSAFLTEKGSSLEQAFAEMCTRFDEDGYESWKLTDLTVSYYKKETEYVQSDGISDYFSAYVKMGVLDEGFEETCRKNAEELRDVQFSLSALYAGDDAPVTVVSGQEIMMLIDKDGCWLFG